MVNTVEVHPTDAERKLMDKSLLKALITVLSIPLFSILMLWLGKPNAPGYIPLYFFLGILALTVYILDRFAGFLDWPAHAIEHYCYLRGPSMKARLLGLWSWVLFIPLCCFLLLLITSFLKAGDPFILQVLLYWGGMAASIIWVLEMLFNVQDSLGRPKKLGFGKAMRAFLFTGFVFFSAVLISLLIAKIDVYRHHAATYPANSNK